MPTGKTVDSCMEQIAEWCSERDEVNNNLLSVVLWEKSFHSVFGEGIYTCWSVSVSMLVTLQGTNVKEIKHYRGCPLLLSLVFLVVFRKYYGHFVWMLVTLHIKNVRKC